jgi:NADH-quinone oxidoreductase subunit D
MALRTEEIIVNVGPQHPSTHGVLRMLVTLSGETILKVDPIIGYLHRGMEKIAEKRTYTQYLPFTDRWDYLSPMFNNMVYSLAVERLMQVEVPPRAQYLRVIAMELNRIASHLVWFATFTLDLSAVTMSAYMYGFREREEILDLLERLSGGRMLYSYICPGGVRGDADDEFLRRLDKFLDTFPKKVDEYETFITQNRVFQLRTRDVGILPLETAINYGVTGPCLRASGLAFDIRKAQPYCVYDQFSFDIPVGDKGDCFDRYWVRIREMREAVKIIRQAMENLPKGDILKKLPPQYKVPEGEAFVWIESPRGALGVYLISDGGTKPYRLKIRAPSFSNLSVINEIARGMKVQDLIAILGSLDILLGEIDR